MSPSKRCKSHRIMLLGNEGTISEAHEGHRVSYGRELLPGAVTGEGHLVAARPACPETAVSWAGLLPSSTPTRPPSWCLVLPESPYQGLWPALPASQPPRLRTQTFKTRREGTGKAAKWTNSSPLFWAWKPVCQANSKGSILVTRCEKQVCWLCSLLSVFCRWGTCEVL